MILLDFVTAKYICVYFSIFLCIVYAPIIFNLRFKIDVVVMII